MIVFAFLFVADRYRVQPIKDFSKLATFRKANGKLKFIPKVVFIGDSITANWNLETSFPGRAYVNRGIAWQTTSQVLLRMHQDVVDLHPKAVVIEAGTNDLSGIVGDVNTIEIESNYRSMFEIGSSNGIRVVFASVLPVNEYSKDAKSRHVFAFHPPEKIKALNEWLRGFSTEHGLPFLDYCAAMVDERGFLRSDLSDDGLHPNISGYSVMANVVGELGPSPEQWAAFSAIRSRGWLIREQPQVKSSGKFVREK